MFDPGTVVTDFGYIRDRLFLVCCLLYAGNRWLVKPLVEPGFLHSHFNDLLLIPCALPLMVLFHRKTGLRSHDGPPTAGEIALHPVVWGILFEGIGPIWVAHATGDPLDLLAYGAGAVVAGLWWNRSRVGLRRWA